MVQVLTHVLSASVMAAGVRGRSIRRNNRAQNQAGYVKANPVWINTLRQYEVGFIPMLVDAWKDLEAMFEVTDGGAYGFLIEDPKDRACTQTDGIVKKVGATWYLHKRYAVGADYRDRRISRPRSGVVVQVDGITTAATVSTTTGSVTFAPEDEPGGGAVVTWAGKFYVPVHFADDQIDWELVRSGEFGTRMVAGPTVLLNEVRE